MRDDNVQLSYSGAYSHCKRALSIREKQFGSCDIRVAQTCNIMGIIQRQLGRYEEAKAMVERSLSIKESKFGDRPHPEIAGSLNGLAEIEKELEQ